MNSLNYNTTEIRRLVVCVCVCVSVLVSQLRFCKALGSLIPNYPAGKASKSMKRLNWNCQSGQCIMLSSPVTPSYTLGHGIHHFQQFVRLFERICVYIASFPGRFGGEETAWAPLLTHAHHLHKNMGIRIREGIQTYTFLWGWCACVNSGAQAVSSPPEAAWERG